MALAKCGTAATSGLPTFWSESNQPIMTCQRRASKSSPGDEDLGDCHMTMMIVIIVRGRVQNSYLFLLEPKGCSAYIIYQHIILYHFFTFCPKGSPDTNKR